MKLVGKLDGREQHFSHRRRIGRIGLAGRVNVAETDGERNSAMQPFRELDELVVRMLRIEQLIPAAGRQDVPDRAGAANMLEVELFLRILGSLTRRLDGSFVIFGAAGSDRRVRVRIELSGKIVFVLLFGLGNSADLLGAVLCRLKLIALKVGHVDDSREPGPEARISANLIRSRETAKDDKRRIFPFHAVRTNERPSRETSILVGRVVFSLSTLRPGNNRADGLTVRVLDNSLVLSMIREALFEVAKVPNTIGLELNDLTGRFFRDVPIEDDHQVAADQLTAKDHPKTILKRSVVEILGLRGPIGERLAYLGLGLFESGREIENRLTAISPDYVDLELVQNALEVFAITRGISGERDQTVTLFGRKRSDFAVGLG